MEVIIVNFRDIGIGDNDEGQVSKSLYSVRKAIREEVEGKGRG